MYWATKSSFVAAAETANKVEGNTAVVRMGEHCAERRGHRPHHVRTDFVEPGKSAHVLGEVDKSAVPRRKLEALRYA